MSQSSLSSSKAVTDIVNNEGDGLMEDTFRRHGRISHPNAHRSDEKVDGVHQMISDLDRVVSKTLDGAVEASKDEFRYTNSEILERVAPCATCNRTPILIVKENVNDPTAAIEYAVRCTVHTRDHGTLFEPKRKSAIIAKWNHMQVRLKHLSTGHLQNTSEGQKLAHGTIKKKRRIS